MYLNLKRFTNKTRTIVGRIDVIIITFLGLLHTKFFVFSYKAYKVHVLFISGLARYKSNAYVGH